MERKEVLIGKVLSSPAKTGIVVLLQKRGKVGFEELRRELEMSNGALDYQLKSLAAAGIITQAEDGKWILSEPGTQISGTIRQVVSSTITT